MFFESFFELIIGLLELCDAPTFCKPSELSSAHFVNLLLSHWRWFGQSLLQSLIQLCADRHPAEILQKAALGVPLVFRKVHVVVQKMSVKVRLGVVFPAS